MLIIRWAAAPTGEAGQAALDAGAEVLAVPVGPAPTDAAPIDAAPTVPP